MKRGNTDPGLRARPAVAAAGSSRPVPAPVAAPPRPSVPTAVPTPAPGPIALASPPAPPEPARFPQKGAPMPDSTGGEPRPPLRPTPAEVPRPSRPLVSEPAVPPASRLPMLLAVGGAILVVAVLAVLYFARPAPATAGPAVNKAPAAPATARVITLGMSSAL